MSSNELDSKKQEVGDVPTTGCITPLVVNILQIWQRWLSPFSFPFLNEPNVDANQALTSRRDVTVIMLLLLAVAAFVFFDPSQPTVTQVLLIAFAIWRTTDVFLMVLSHGIFGGLFVPVPGVHWLFSASRAELQRVLCLMLLNYLEAIFLYAVLYLAVGENAFAGSTTTVVSTHERAFFVSLSTMTTVGYGTFAPVSSVALVIATIQSLTVIIFVGMLFGVVLSGLRGEAAEEASPTKSFPNARVRFLNWFTPVLIFAIIYGITFLAIRRAGAS
jgi:hypothetical protein